MKIKLLIAAISGLLMTAAYADTPTVVEETTPPPAEGAITPDQLPPMMTVIKQPAAPSVPSK